MGQSQCGASHWAIFHGWSLNAAGPHQPPLYPSTGTAPCTTCTSRSRRTGEQRGLCYGVHGKTGEQVTSHTTPQTNHIIHRASLFSSRYHSSPLLHFCFFKQQQQQQKTIKYSKPLFVCGSKRTGHLASFNLLHPLVCTVGADHRLLCPCVPNGLSSCPPC